MILLDRTLRVESEEAIPEETIEELPLNGVFQCEYYKSVAQKIPDVANFEVFPEGGEWMWRLDLHDGTSLFYSQTAGQFCYVHNVEE